MRILVTYANQRYRYNQTLNRRSAQRVGSFDRIVRRSPRHLDAAFRARNRDILRDPIGAGFWLWKPYIIHQTLLTTSPGDLIFYCDSGAVFVSSVDPLFALLRETGQDVIAFELPHREREFTKRDAFVLMGCDAPAFVESRQRLASYIVFRNSEASRSLVREWLEHGEDARLITGRANTTEAENYPGFVEHRWDQSIFSLLTKKHGLRAFRDPSQFGEPFRADYPGSTYGQIVAHTRYVRDPLYFAKPANWPYLAKRTMEKLGLRKVARRK